MSLAHALGDAGEGKVEPLLDRVLLAPLLMVGLAFHEQDGGWVRHGWRPIPSNPEQLSTLLAPNPANRVQQGEGRLTLSKLNLPII
jgi:hypothetical protein